MASEQIMNKAIMKVLAEVTRVAIQAMAAATGEGMQSMTGPKLGNPAMKQPSLNWEAEDKYNELKAFRQEVNNILSTYDSPQNEQLVMVKKLAGKKGTTFCRSANK